MKISAQMLYEAVKQDTRVTLAGESSPERNLRFLGFYGPGMTFMTSGGVYLTEELPKTMPVGDALLVICSPTVPRELPGVPVLVFHEETDLQKVFNRLQTIFVTFCAWEEKLDAVLQEDSNVQKLIDLCDGMIAHPLCVVDNSLQYLGYSGSFMSRERDLFLRDSVPVPALFYHSDRDRKAELEHENFPLGTLYMIGDDVPFTQTELLLFRLLTEKLTLAILNLSILSGLYQNTFKENILSLFQSGQVEEEKLWQSLEQWGGRQGDTFLCYKVKAAYVHRKINADYVCRIFENVLFQAVAFWQNGVLVVLVDVSRNQGSEEQMHRKMEGLLTRMKLKAGVSMPFTDLTRSWYHFRQACCAFEEGIHRDGDNHLFFFRDYVGSYMLHHALGEFPRSYLLDPGVQRLVEHDSQYSVSYMETLDAFFRCRMNMSQTAEALGIHRTSLNSRMQKIQELLDHEMTQEYVLYLQMILAIMKEK